LLWGFHAVRAAWTNPARRIIRLLVTDAGLSGFKDTLDAGTLKRPQPEVIDKLAFDRLMPPGAVHQGIAALVETLPMRDAHDLIAGLQEGEKAVLIILDQVTDPHNVGAILRSAAAFGAKGVILQDRHAPEMNGVLAKTASGAADVIPIAAETNLARIIELLQENGFFVIGLDERGMPIGELAKYDRLALVLGAEGAGIRQNVASHCDGLVCLPTQGPILSLNVSNAAAVALYAVTS
jgi:23S rRNA (guanosine2251-2'-O)-methyltransferase